MTVPTIYSSQLPTNTVRAFEGATTVGHHAVTVTDADNNNRPTMVEIVLAKGKASQGYRSDYERLETWWTELSVIGRRGKRTFGRRYTGPKAERKARADFNESKATWEEATR